jgi:hypothetical protein
MDLVSTSTQRTYRYVRLAIVGAVIALAAAIVQVSVTLGPLASISAAFYTPARTVFVGALFAVALAFVALSGRSLERVLLDYAALFAPVVAIVPTPIATGEVPGMVVACRARCVPAIEIPGVVTGMTAFTVIGVIGVATALVLAVVQGRLGAASLVSMGVAAGIVVGLAAWAIGSPSTFLSDGHLVAASGFFTMIAGAAAVASIAARGTWRLLYGIIAAGIVLDLLWLVLRREVFAGEAVAIVLFGGLWIAQTVQNWNEVNPRYVAA